MGAGSHILVCGPGDQLQVGGYALWQGPLPTLVWFSRKQQTMALTNMMCSHQGSTLVMKRRIQE